MAQACRRLEASRGPRVWRWVQEEGDAKLKARAERVNAMFVEVELPRFRGRLMAERFRSAHHLPWAAGGIVERPARPGRLAAAPLAPKTGPQEARRASF